MVSERPEIVKFFELALNAKRADDELRAEFSNVEYEAVLDHVLANPELRSDLVGAFLKIAYDPSLGPIDLVEFCMHYLRWEEVELSFLNRLETERSERARSALRRLLGSFDQNWPEADLYRRFRKVEDEPPAN